VSHRRLRRGEAHVVPSVQRYKLHSKKHTLKNQFLI
jgi:hypothetical protein